MRQNGPQMIYEPHSSSSLHFNEESTDDSIMYVQKLHDITSHLGLLVS